MPAPVDAPATRAIAARPPRSERVEAPPACRCPSGRKRQLGTYPMWRDLAQGKLCIAAEGQLQALTQRGKPGAQSATHRLQPHAGVGDAQNATARLESRLDVDVPAQFAGIDAVTHGVL